MEESKLPLGKEKVQEKTGKEIKKEKTKNSRKKQRVYGYVRVSARDQKLDRQMEAMLEFGIKESMIFREKISGKDFERPEWTRLMKKLQKGDVLVVKSIDRFGRNYLEILDYWRRITREIGADIVVLDMPLLDTRDDNGRDLAGTLISDIVLQLLSYVAQTEREFIHQRQMEGIAAAKALGVVFGRRPKEIPTEFPKLFMQWQEGRISMSTAAKRLGVDRKTFRKWTYIA